MPKTQTLLRTSAGLFTFPNYLTAPEGAMLEATNVVIERDGVIAKRRGFERFGTMFNGPPSAIFEFGGRLIVLDGSTLKYDASGSGSWGTWAGSFAHPASDAKIRSVQANGSLYFTTSQGIYSTDSLTTSPTQAGMPQALNINFGIGNYGAGWFTADSQVGYRILWGRIDANKRLILGSPSFRETYSNALSGPWPWTMIGTGPYTITVTHASHGFAAVDYVTIKSASDVHIPDGQYSIISATGSTYSFSVNSGAPAASGTLTEGRTPTLLLNFPIPDGILSTDFFEVYRTELTLTAATDPGDRCFKIARRSPVDIELTNKLASFLDTYDPVFLGEELYTNATQETVLQANERPPWARDIAQYKTYVFFLNTYRRAFVEFQLDSAKVWDGTTGIKRHPTDASPDNITFTSGSSTFTYVFANAQDIPNRRFLLSTAEPTAEKNIRATAKSLIDTINQDPNNSILYAYYVSGIDDSAGKILVERRTLNTPEIYITTTANGADKWNPALPTSGNSYRSETDARKNRLYHAKSDQPDAVPELNYDDVGLAHEEGLRILALRDSLIILKSAGIWRLSGETERDFTIKQLDPSTNLVAPEAAAVLDNSVYCLSSQGVVKITESGTSIISRPIEGGIREILGLSTSSTAHAVAYESERKYIAFATDTSHSKPFKAKVYDYITKEWVEWIKHTSCAWVRSSNDTLYLGHSIDPYIVEERKNYSIQASLFSTLYSDETKGCVVTAVNITTDSSGVIVSLLTITYDAGGDEQALQAGYLFEQTGSGSSLITSVISLGGNSYSIQLNSYLPSAIIGAATLKLPIPSRIRWVPEDAENPGVMKQFTSVQFYLDDKTASFSKWAYRIGFLNDLDTSGVPIFLNDINVTTLVSGQPMAVIVPQDFQRGTSLSLFFESNRAQEYFSLLNVAYTFRVTGGRTTVAQK